MGGGTKGNCTAKGQDTAGDDHPVNVWRRAVDLRRAMVFIHLNGESSLIVPETAQLLLEMYGELHKAAEKEIMLDQVWKSCEAFADFLNGNIYMPETKKITLPGTALIGGSF